VKTVSVFLQDVYHPLLIDTHWKQAAHTQDHREMDSICVLHNSLYQKCILDGTARPSTSPDT